MVSVLTSLDDVQISISSVFFLSFLCCTHSFLAACWAHQSCQKLERGRVSSTLSLSNLLLCPHALPEALPSSRDPDAPVGRITLPSPSPFASPDLFPHSHVTRWLSRSPNQPSCSAPGCGSHHILPKHSSDHVAAVGLCYLL